MFAPFQKISYRNWAQVFIQCLREWELNKKHAQAKGLCFSENRWITVMKPQNYFNHKKLACFRNVRKSASSQSKFKAAASLCRKKLI